MATSGSSSTFQANNFISIHDLTPEGRTLWVSDSIYDCLGYTPEEFLQTTTYELLHPDDVAIASVTHREHVLNDMVATQIVLRFRAKDGTYVANTSLFSVCYDFIINCTTIVDPAAVFQGIKLHSAAMTRLAGSRKEEFERIRRHHEAFSSEAWNTGELAPEARACMILNRFSRNLGVMYASPSCELVLQIDPEEIIGKPLLLFIRADDLAAFVEQADLAKTSTVMTHMRFWFQSPNCPHEIPLEAMFFGCADGMVAILRQSRPFVRKRLIGSMEHFDFVRRRGMSPLSSSLGSTNSSSSRFQSYGSSLASSFSPSPPAVYVPNIDSRHDDDPDGFRLPRLGMRSVPMGSIQNIQNLERDQSRFRPLTIVQLTDSTFGTLPRGYQLREIVQIDSDEDDDDEEEESVFRQSDDDNSHYDDQEDQLMFDDGEDDNEGGEYDEVYEQLENFGVVPSSPAA
ncbi:hypothetical protein BGZ96_004908 [Linnemannia gamsii]|uniref:PAS domain-containing protein n=1 Tax=Linnemannia gamsii TaxID=64522 RepID=A0ABQ7K5N3_9FUNG|nr:hypothetical protein BGZ96_004908 [Linnemannia gamsii]